MPARLIDGRKVASDIQDNLKKEVSELKVKRIYPCLAVIFDESAPLSKRHVELKKKTCKEIGINIFVNNIQELKRQKDLISLVDKLNTDLNINGILIQFPLSKRFNLKEAVNKIAPEKDIDGCNPYNLGKLILDEPCFVPCTPHGAVEMLKSYNIDIAGKHAVVVERDIIFGRTIALLFLRNNATVTICHSNTPNLKEECLRADILCVAAGRAKMVSADMVKNGATVIDLGMNVSSDGKIAGDVDFDIVKEKAAYITPVPGGTGPVTVAMLLHNTVLATKMQNKIL